MKASARRCFVVSLLNDDCYSIGELKPWYKNFKGSIERKDKGEGWQSVGKWERKDRTTIVITELPIGVWTENYKEMLEKLSEDDEMNITDIKDNKTDRTVCFEVKAPSLKIDEWMRNGEIVKLFKLKSAIGWNLTLFDEKGKIRQFDSVEEILYHFFIVREKLYEKRYAFLTEHYRKIQEELSAKVLFIQRIIDGSIEVFRKPKRLIVEQLVAQSFPKVDNSYDFLLNIKIHQFSEEQIELLEKENNTVKALQEEHERKTYKDLWKEDLNKLENALA